jgi:hypothetical protein
MHSDTQILTLYIPWLAAALAGALELELVHRLRRLFFGVHPAPAGVRWLLLCLFGMGCAAGLAYVLGMLEGLLHARVFVAWGPWAVYFAYMFIIAEVERRGARAAREEALAIARGED